MGMYDSIMVPCPSCGHKQEAQSKSGPRNMDVFTLVNAPEDVFKDVNRHAPFQCTKCGGKFYVVNDPERGRTTAATDSTTTYQPPFPDRAKVFLRALDRLSQEYGVHLSGAVVQGDAGLLLLDGYKSVRADVSISDNASEKVKA